MGRWASLGYLLGLLVLVAAILFSAWWNNQEIRGIGLRIHPKADLTIKDSPRMVTATVKFVNGTHERTLGFQAPTYAELRAAVDQTQADLAREWQSEVTVTWVGP